MDLEVQYLLLIAMVRILFLYWIVLVIFLVFAAIHEAEGVSRQRAQATRIARNRRRRIAREAELAEVIASALREQILRQHGQ
jgi:hypothetical protein